MTSFFKNVSSSSQLGQLAEGIASAVASSSGAESSASPAARAGAASASASASALRLRILALVYNAVDARETKLSLLAAVVAYAAASRQLEQLAPFLSSIAAPSWQADWGLADAEARRVFLLLSQVYSAAGDAQQGQAYLIRYLATFEAASASALEEVRATATCGWPRGAGRLQEAAANRPPLAPSPRPCRPRSTRATPRSATSARPRSRSAPRWHTSRR